MSRSRIKLQSEEIENIKDETEDIDKQRRREDKREKEHVELKKEVERLEEDILSLETEFEDRNRGLVELQNHYASLIEKKESMSINRK
jgi:flagellar motility protein MotE (MotC chaperone)